VWLSCAASNGQWFQGLLVFSRELSVSLQARSSQVACIPFLVVMNHGVGPIINSIVYIPIRDFQVDSGKQTVDEALAGTGR